MPDVFGLGTEEDKDKEKEKGLHQNIDETPIPSPPLDVGKQIGEDRDPQ